MDFGNLVDTQSGVAEEVADELRVALQMAGAAAGSRRQFHERGREGVGHPPFDEGIGLLLRVQLRRVRRQEDGGIVPRAGGEDAPHAAIGERVRAISH